MDKLNLHPGTIKSLKNGHPWITKDKYSDSFPLKSLLKIKDRKTDQFLGHFIHDPAHPKVKARYWGKNTLPFELELKERLREALHKRKPLLTKRENVYLVFGEVDQLPGLFIQLLGENLLIQYQSFFWEKKVDNIAAYFKKKIKVKAVWVQKRLPGEQKAAPVGKGKSNIVVKEGDISFKLKFNLGHDVGIYTDMAAIREDLLPYFKESKSILNLFSYTGAFSLMGLKENAKVTSVDLSKTYMNWLDENITLNHFNKDNHHALVGPCSKVLGKLKESGKKFDLIISDPPSFSTDGKKRTSALDFYKKELKNLIELLEDGGHLVVFLNTHSIARKKFKSVIKELSEDAEIIRDIYLTEDCPVLRNFPEGDYLKGFVLKKTGPLHY